MSLPAHRIFSAGGSLLIHITGVALLIALSSVSKPAARVVSQTVKLIAPKLEDWMPKTRAVKLDKPPGGGGGGSDLLPASRGEAPRTARRQFVPPAAVVNNPAPVLLMEPTLAMAQAELPKVNMDVWGDPRSRFGTPSNGPGRRGGIGSGWNGGIGSGEGPRIGPGDGEGTGGVYRPGGGVSWPAILYKVEPEYSEEARKAKFEGVFVVSVVVDERGLARDFKIIRQLGLGLDEEAIKAIRKWRFRPGRRDGRPVAVRVPIEVTFRLL
jgi:protein TonB